MPTTYGGNNGYINKVIYDDTVLIDLTSDNVAASLVLAKDGSNNNVYFHLPTGERVQGSCTYDADTSDATALATEVLSGKTFYKNGQKITGSMTDRGSVTGTIATVAGQYTIPQGYHDGGGYVSIDATEQLKIIAGNIKAGIEILGVMGTYSGESINVRSATATPTSSDQTILPGEGYDYLSQVTVYAIPYTETLNAAGGYTASIACS